MKPGAQFDRKTARFSYFCSRAELVEVHLLDSFRHTKPDVIRPMQPTRNGWWFVTIEGNFEGFFYGFRIHNPSGFSRHQPVTEHLIVDPYARFWAVENSYLQKPLGKLVHPAAFEWGSDTFVAPADPRDLVVYESHIKDLVAHPSAHNRFPGTSVFSSFTDALQEGGIAHLKYLGVNAIEFLPLQHFAYFEPPFLEATSDGQLNTWNYYGRNYWGYMPSSYFVPHLLYGPNASLQPGAIVDNAVETVQELKTMVRTLHQNRIAVIVDVVYNHISQFDLNPLKYCDINYVLRKNSAGFFTSASGCGNDLRSEAPEIRRLIIDSLIYWMTEFHVDGFRFDLATILDWETVDAIKDALRTINPYVILIAEPWGGGYDPSGFSQRDWAAWNDRFRNGIKGSDPVHDKGFLFGGWQKESTRFSLENYLQGTLYGKDGGRFVSTKHTVNYLESHDNHTLADFIRIALNGENLKKRHTEVEAFQTLSAQEMNVSKLAALILFSSQGLTMLHAGQEMGRGKLIARTAENDPDSGKIDHNSYEKDNVTNWLHFGLKNWNHELFSFYRELIEIRKNAPALRKSPPESFRFEHAQNPLQLDITISGKESGDPFDYRLVLNGDRSLNMSAIGSDGWQKLISTYVEPNLIFKTETENLVIPPGNGVLFSRMRNLSN